MVKLDVMLMSTLHCTFQGGDILGSFIQKMHLATQMRPNGQGQLQVDCTTGCEGHKAYGNGLNIIITTSLVLYLPPAACFLQFILNHKFLPPVSGAMAGLDDVHVVLGCKPHGTFCEAAAGSLQ